MSAGRLPFITADRAQDWIAGVVLRRLRVNRDARGLLVETLRRDWEDVFDPARRPFAQTYYSVTLPGVARDEDRWHVHQYQEDRFVVAAGTAVVAIYDARPSSPTYGRLNLVLLGEAAGDDGQVLVLIPPGTLHGFVCVGSTPCVLMNYPTQLYNPADEGRVPFAEAGVHMPDGRPFAWDLIRRGWRQPASDPG